MQLKILYNHESFMHRGAKRGGGKGGTQPQAPASRGPHNHILDLTQGIWSHFAVVHDPANSVKAIYLLQIENKLLVVNHLKSHPLFHAIVI